MVTRYYFHTATSTIPNLPTTEQSTLTVTSGKNADALTLNRVMDTNIGTGEVSNPITTNASTSQQTLYYSRFVSPELNINAIAANTWTYNFAAWNASTNANFPVGGTNQPVYLNVYVWRPGTGKVGTIIDGNTASTVNEPAGTTETAHNVNFTGAAVTGMQSGDVICCEIWFRVTQANATARVNNFAWNGTTVTTTSGTAVNNHASFIESPENFATVPPSIDMEQVSAVTHSNKFITGTVPPSATTDHWGTTYLFATSAGGREYYAPLDTGTNGRVLTNGNRDPSFPTGDMKVESDSSTYTIDTTAQTITLSAGASNFPRLYFFDVNRAIFWENVEITVYYKWGTASGVDPWTGMEICTRGKHETQIGNDQVRTYSVRHGQGDKEWYRMKEDTHPNSNDVTEVTSVTFNAGVWYGMKFVVQNVGSTSVRLRSYRDTTDGAGGGTWTQMFDFTDTGSNWFSQPAYRSGVANCDDKVFFFKVDNGTVSNYQMKKISCHAIDPLP